MTAGILSNRSTAPTIGVALGLLLVIGVFASAGAEEVTIKDLDDIVTEVPGLGGKIMAKTVSKVRGFYRGKRPVLLEHRKTVTLEAEDGKKASELTFYFVEANGRTVARIEKPSFTISSVTSPWPISIDHVNQTKEGRGSGHCNIAIPAIGFFESLEFKDGELLPLPSGERFEAFKDGQLEFAKEQLDPKCPQ